MLQSFRHFSLKPKFAASANIQYKMRSCNSIMLQGRSQAKPLAVGTPLLSALLHTQPLLKQLHLVFQIFPPPFD